MAGMNATSRPQRLSLHTLILYVILACLFFAHLGEVRKNWRLSSEVQTLRSWDMRIATREIREALESFERTKDSSQLRSQLAEIETSVRSRPIWGPEGAD